MMSKTTRKLATTFFVLALITASACSKKEVKEDVDTNNADVASGMNSDAGNAMGIQTVNFPYDSYTIDSTAQSKLNSNAQILKDQASVRIQVEGHCDERGGIQYNLALGEKRANAVKKYMMDRGVSGDRIEIISFGKERPLDSGHSEDAWAKNRRANFVILSK